MRKLVAATKNARLSEVEFMAAPYWLRGEPTYRAHIYALRACLTCFAGAPIGALLLYMQVFSVLMTKIWTLGFVACYTISIFVGIVAIVLMPDKNRAANQGSYAFMVAHDLFWGIPRTSPGDIPNEVKGWNPVPFDRPPTSAPDEGIAIYDVD